MQLQAGSSALPALPWSNESSNSECGPERVRLCVEAGQLFNGRSYPPTARLTMAHDELWMCHESFESHTGFTTLSLSHQTNRGRDRLVWVRTQARAARAPSAILFPSMCNSRDMFVACLQPIWCFCSSGLAFAF